SPFVTTWAIRGSSSTRRTRIRGTQPGFNYETPKHNKHFVTWLCTNSENPPNGSLGIVQVLSKIHRLSSYLNPPNGSLGMVQVRPIYLMLDFRNCSVPKIEW